MVAQLAHGAHEPEPITHRRELLSGAEVPMVVMLETADRVKRKVRSATFSFIRGSECLEECIRLTKPGKRHGFARRPKPGSHRGVRATLAQTRHERVRISTVRVAKDDRERTRSIVIGEPRLTRLRGTQEGRKLFEVRATELSPERREEATDARAPGFADLKDAPASPHDDSALRTARTCMPITLASSMAPGA